MKTIIVLFCYTLATVAQAVDVIPGIMPVDVYLNLERKGFTTEKKFAAATGANQSEFICRMETNACRYTAIIYMPPGQSSKVWAVSGVMQNLTGDANSTNEWCAPFLGYLASLPYSGGSPEEAQAWVKANVGKKAERMFGLVKIELHSQERTRVIRLSMEPLKEGRPVATTHNNKIIYGHIGVEVGQTFDRVVEGNGKPSIQDQDTGWAFWPHMRVKFADGKATEVVIKKP